MNNTLCCLSILKCKENVYQLILGSENMIDNYIKRWHPKVLDTFLLIVSEKLSYLYVMKLINKFLTYKVLMFELIDDVMIKQKIELYKITEEDFLKYVHYIVKAI